MSTRKPKKEEWGARYALEKGERRKTDLQATCQLGDYNYRGSPMEFVEVVRWGVAGGFCEPLRAGDRWVLGRR